MSKTTLPAAISSASQPLQPPAETWRSRSERPKRLRILPSSDVAKLTYNAPGGRKLMRVSTLKATGDQYLRCFKDGTGKAAFSRV